MTLRSLPAAPRFHRVRAGLLVAMGVSALYAHGADAQCNRFGNARQTGALGSPIINESSGLAPSFHQQDVWWTHNDSGDSARIFALDDTGALLSTHNVLFARHNDWEDMAIGPCDEADACLFVADFGDNPRRRSTITLYRFAEPTAGTGGTVREGVAMTIRYPQSEARDAEALLIDPETGDALFVEKTNGRARVTMLQDAGRLQTGDYAAENVGELANYGTITGGDFSPFGDEFVVRDYTDVAMRYLVGRDADGHVDGFVPASTGIAVATWGEAIAYRPDGMAVRTTIEGDRTPMHETACVDPDASAPGPAVGRLAPVPEAPDAGPGTDGPGDDTPPAGGCQSTAAGPGALGLLALVWATRRRR